MKNQVKPLQDLKAIIQNMNEIGGSDDIYDYIQILETLKLTLDKELDKAHEIVKTETGV